MFGFDVRVARAAWTFAVAILIYGAFLIRTTIFRVYHGSSSCLHGAPACYANRALAPESARRVTVSNCLRSTHRMYHRNHNDDWFTQVSDEAASLSEQIPQWVNDLKPDRSYTLALLVGRSFALEC